MSTEPLDAALRSRFTKVLEKIRSAASAAGRGVAEVVLVAVTKRRSVDELRAVCALCREFAVPVVCAESYVQELRSKRQYFPPDGELHLIGPLQSNKVRDAVAVSDVIQSVHSRKVLTAVAEQAARIGKRQRIFLQVNISADERKSGFACDELPAVIEAASELSSSVELEGLMTITAQYEYPAGARGDFQKMAELRRQLLRHGLGRAFRGHTIRLSMGMSADFDIAIEEGADLVRVGSAIFDDQ